MFLRRRSFPLLRCCHCFFCQGRCLWIKMEFFAWIIVSFVGGDVVIVGGEVECFV